VESQHGLLTTVAYQLGRRAPPVYALEGSVATAGDLFSWLKDSLELFNDFDGSEALAGEADAGEPCEVALVPAFSGLLTPHWSRNATGWVVLSIKSMV